MYNPSTSEAILEHEMEAEGWEITGTRRVLSQIEKAVAKEMTQAFDEGRESYERQKKLFPIGHGNGLASAESDSEAAQQNNN
jgi:hypothetical protein